MRDNKKLYIILFLLPAFCVGILFRTLDYGHLLENRFFLKMKVMLVLLWISLIVKISCVGVYFILEKVLI